MITLDNIIEAYFVARANKRKSPDLVRCEMHWQRNCVALFNDICNRSVLPTAYTFIAKTPKPREVFASDFKTRILHHYLDIRLRPLLDKRLSPHSFNNRIGMGTSACLHAVFEDIKRVTNNYTEGAWIIKLDMSGCFPNIVLLIAYDQLEEVIILDYFGEDKEELIYMLKTCIFSNPTLHCYRKSQISEWDLIDPNKSLFNKPIGIGAAIGHLIWLNAVNYYFHEIDEFVESEGIAYERYVDDMYFIVKDKEYFLTNIIPKIREILKSLGAKLNENKFYCLYYDKGCECLGVHFKSHRIYVNKRVVNRGLAKAKEFNKVIRVSKINKIISSLNSYFGLLKNTLGFNQAIKIVDILSHKWEKYIKFNTKKVCIQTLPKYSVNELIIKKFKLKKYDTGRKR